MFIVRLPFGAMADCGAMKQLSQTVRLGLVIKCHIQHHTRMPVIRSLQVNRLRKWTKSLPKQTNPEGLRNQKKQTPAYLVGSATITRVMEAGGGTWDNGSPGVNVLLANFCSKTQVVYK